MSAEQKPCEMSKEFNDVSCIVLLVLSSFFTSPIALAFGIVSAIKGFKDKKIEEANKYAKIGWICFIAESLLAVGIVIFCLLFFGTIGLISTAAVAH